MIISLAHTKFGAVQYLEKDYYIAFAFEEGLVWEEEVVTKHLEPYIKSAKVILDIGAHVGSHTLMYSRMNNDCEIYSFEMQSVQYDLLKRNIQINHLQNVSPFRCAVGNSVRMVSISETIDDGPNSNKPYSYTDGLPYNFGGVSIGEGSEEIIMITIDSLKLEACDLIKVDVEGFEYFVLAGAMETILKFKPTIFYEENHKIISPYMSQNFTVSEEHKEPFSASRLLKSLGYNHFEQIDDNVLARWVEEV